MRPVDLYAREAIWLLWHTTRAPHPTGFSPPVPAKAEPFATDQIPDSERHGHPAQQFTLWFAANMVLAVLVSGFFSASFGLSEVGQPLLPSGDDRPLLAPRLLATTVHPHGSSDSS